MLPQFRLAFDTSTMLMQAQTVIALRLMGMAGVTRARPDENLRMVSEKVQAGQRAGTVAWLALLQGAAPVAIAQAALRPVGRATRADVRRLTR